MQASDHPSVANEDGKTDKMDCGICHGPFFCKEA